MTTITENLKAYSFVQDIDLIGVAPVDRFAGAPQEHHPEDILPGAKTVISLALHIPSRFLIKPCADLCSWGNCPRAPILRSAGRVERLVQLA